MHIILSNENLHQLKTLKRHDSFEATCEKCGTKYTVNDFRPERMDRYQYILCQPCFAKKQKLERFGSETYNNRESAAKTKEERYGDATFNNRAKSIETCLDKYGVTNPNKSREVREKVEQTNLDRYGTKCSLRNEDVNKKTLATMQERYGVNYTAESEELRNKMNATREERYGNPGYTNREKAISTMITRYNTDSPMKLEEFQAKAIATNNDKFGADHFARSEEWKTNYPFYLEKQRQTCIERFGTDNYAKTDEFKEMYQEKCEEINEKRIATNIERFGTDHYCKSEEYRSNLDEIKEKISQTCKERYGVNWPILKRSQFYYYGLKFDSEPEFCFFIFMLEMGFIIIRNPVVLQYEFEGKAKEYHPDFMVNGQLIEIKGAHFFKSDGSMQNPYDHSQDDLYEAKHQCGLRNGVIFITDHDPIIYMARNYVISKYGRDYQMNFDTECPQFYQEKEPLQLKYYHDPYNFMPMEDNPEYSLIGSYANNEGFGLTPFDIE